MSGAAAAALSLASPPPQLECNIIALPSGTRLHRIHEGRFGALEFNPGFGDSRFAPLEIAGRKIPTAYAATSLECAIFESVFHDVEPSAPFKSVRWSAMRDLRYSVIETTRAMGLASLFSADLMGWGIERNRLIDTPRSAYSRTRAWTPAIHASAASPEGLIWTSRKFDEDRALMLFGDRVVAADLVKVSSVRLTSDASSLGVLVNLARRGGVVLTR